MMGACLFTLLLRGHYRALLPAEIIEQGSVILECFEAIKPSRELEWCPYGFQINIQLDPLSNGNSHIKPALEGDWETAAVLAGNDPARLRELEVLRVVIDPFYYLAEDKKALREDIVIPSDSRIVTAIELMRRDIEVPGELLVEVDRCNTYREWFLRGYFDLAPWGGYPFADY
ncbi:hypothetical protein BH09SUM1_BH09SUM1_34360 [soil metagenome]